MRKFLFAIILLLGVIFLFTRLAEFQAILETLRRGNLWFIGLGLALTAAWVLDIGATYHAIFQLFGMEESLFYLARLSLAGTFANTVAPTGGFSTMAVIISNARLRGHAAGLAMVSSVLFVWLDYMATLGYLTLGLGILALQHDLHWPEIAASIVLLLGAAGLGGLLLLGMEAPEALGKVLAGAARRINALSRWFTQDPLLSEDLAHKFSEEIGVGMQILRASPSGFFRPALFALINKGLLALILACCFEAFSVPMSIQTVLGAFAIGHLFQIVSPTPAGIGVVEGVLSVALTSLNVALADAAVITLAYRGLTFWVPLLAGFGAFRSVNTGKSVRS